MPLTLSRADLADPRFAAFLRAHLDETEPTAPVESRHALDLSDLAAPHIRVWVAHDGDELVGSGALAVVEEGHEELKSMRSDPARRGQGIGTYVLEGLIEDARSRGVTRVSLETGSMEFFALARAFYARAGFVPCGPFGAYVEDPYSVFMTRSLVS